MSGLGCGKRGFAALLLALCACSQAAPPNASPHPDVVLVSIDSLRADHLGVYGYPRPTSPTIDRLAVNGVRFEWAVSTTSWTLPAHAALFTGLYDSAHGVVDDGRGMSAAHLTLAEALGDAGYRTAGFYGGPYLHPSLGLAQGFDVYENCMTPEAVSSGPPGEKALRLSHGDVTGPRTVEAVKRWLGDLDARPFFLFVHLWDVHYDYIAPEEYVRRFDPDYSGPLDARNYEQNQGIHAGMKTRDREHLLALYDAEIRFTDDNLAKLLDALDQSGRLDAAMVIVTADHGEEFFEHGDKGHRRTLFDEVVHVPLIVSAPGRVPQGRVVAEPVRLIDVMPTVLALAGLPTPTHVQGRDLAPLWRGESLPEEPALIELLKHGVSLRALRTARYKWFSPGPREVAFGFDLERDPGEQLPIRPADELRQGLHRLHSEVAASVERRREIGGDPVNVELNPSLWDRLRALGYVEDDRQRPDPEESGSGNAP